jgi:hypothetical protein
MQNTVDRRTLLKALSGAGAAAAMGSMTSAAFAAAKLKPDAGSALLVIDVQNCFVTGGTLPVKGGEDVVPVINRIAPGFQNIIVTQDWHTPGHASFASSYPGKKPFETTKLSYGTQVLWPDHCVQGTDDAALRKDLKLPTATRPSTKPITGRRPAWAATSGRAASGRSTSPASRPTSASRGRRSMRARPASSSTSSKTRRARST